MSVTAKKAPWLERIDAVKGDPLTVADIEALCKDRYTAQDAAEREEPITEQDITELVERYSITRPAARRYFELSGLGRDYEFIDGDIAELSNARLEAALLEMADNDKELAEALLFVRTDRYGLLGIIFMTNMTVHWIGFVFGLTILGGAFLWAVIDIFSGLHQLAWWQRLLFLAIPLGMPFLFKEHRQVLKLAAYRKKQAT